MSGDDSETRFATDTGPLLCFGGVPRGKSILWNHLHHRLEWCLAVRDEVRNLATGTGRRAAAAGVWRTGWLPEPLGLTEAESADALRHHAAIQQIAAQRPGRAAPQPESDRGEADTIALAAGRGFGVLICEHPGMQHAKDLGLQVRTAVDVLRAEVASGQTTSYEAFQLYRRMEEFTHSGEHLNGELDLTGGPARL